MRFSLHFIATLLSIYITTSLFATDYVFIGNGDWNDPNNWEGGAVPLSNPGGSTITIKGTAINGLPFEQCPLVPYNGDYVIQCPEALYDNSGTIIIEVGGSLTLQNDTQFSNGGSFIVYGTLINKTTFEAYDIGNITIYGTFQNEGFIGNQGLITVNNGGSIDNRVTFDNDFVRAGQMIVNSGGIIKNSGSMNLVYATLSDGVVIDNTGTLVGTPTIDGSVNNSGTLSPGHSPGTYTINGNYTATNTAKHIFEVSGTTEGTYDALNVGGTVNLNGTLNVSFIDGYSPTTSDNIPIISGTIKGTFSTVNIPSQYALVYNSNSVVLKSVSLLPVNFISVNAKKESNGIKLSWNVADEYNVIRYEVEKSTNGISFERIGTVNAVH